MNYPTQHHYSGEMRLDVIMRNNRYFLWLTISIVGFIAFVHFIKAIERYPAAAPEVQLFLPEDQTPVIIAAQSSKELIRILKKHNLWEFSNITAIPNILFKKFPDDLATFDTTVKKNVFFHTLLPIAIQALKQIDRERNTLLAVLENIDNPRNIRISNREGVWRARLTSDEITFLESMADKYKSDKPETLVRRIDTIPLSLILAQGAIESSWGSSRFAREGNNLFGVWTWNKNGMIPARRDLEKSHKVAAYDTLFESVSNYLLTLNRSPFYTNFRILREKTKNSLELADGLLYYSERRLDYVNDIKQFIHSNKLTKYDKFLTTMFPENVNPQIKLVQR